MTEFDDWLATVAGALALPPEAVAADLVLDLARDVAHGVLRPAAPLTAYLVGVAVGRGADPATAVAAISRLANGWAERVNSAVPDAQ